MGEACSLKGAFVSLTVAGKELVGFLWACLPAGLGVSEAAPLSSPLGNRAQDRALLLALVCGCHTSFPFFRRWYVQC